MDAQTRAFATLGVRPGCSRGELKRAYRALVKRWHPDRYLADPAGQAEANRQLRIINTRCVLSVVWWDVGRPRGAGEATPPPVSESGPVRRVARSASWPEAIVRSCW
jgi:hypothetical protein